MGVRVKEESSQREEYVLKELMGSKTRFRRRISR
jgi:hypothetical protein